MTSENPYRPPNDTAPRATFDFGWFIWALWWVGFALIALSWVKMIPGTVGWVGTGLTLVSVVASAIARRVSGPPPGGGAA